MHRPLSFDPPWIDIFKRPCPYFISQRASKFTLFPKLPKELQKMIWEEAFCDRRQIFIESVDGPEDEEVPLGVTLPIGARIRKKKILRSSANIPAILHVNYDSRQAGLRMYQPAFAAQLGHPVYINFDRDLLVFPSVSVICLMNQLTPEFGISPIHMDSVQYIWIRNAHRRRGQFISCACHHFNGLNHNLATGEFRDGNPWNSPGPRPLIRPPLKNVDFWAGFKWRIFAPDPVPKNWEPPVITSGNPERWEKVMMSDTGMGWVIGEEDTWGVASIMDWEATAIFPTFNFNPLYGMVIKR